MLAAHSSTSQTQAYDAAVEKRIVALESQVLQLTSTLHDVRTKERQDPGRLRDRLLLIRRAFDAQSASVRKSEDGRGSLIG